MYNIIFILTPSLTFLSSVDYLNNSNYTAQQYYVVSDYLVFNIKSTCGLGKLVSSQHMSPDFLFLICYTHAVGERSSVPDIYRILTMVCVHHIVLRSLKHSKTGEHFKNRKRHNRGHCYCCFLRDDLSNIFFSFNLCTHCVLPCF